MQTMKEGCTVSRQSTIKTHFHKFLLAEKIRPKHAVSYYRFFNTDPCYHKPDNLKERGRANLYSVNDAFVSGRSRDYNLRTPDPARPLPAETEEEKQEVKYFFQLYIFKKGKKEVKYFFPVSYLFGLLFCSDEILVSLKRISSCL
jgi:hypothetical protein